MNATLPVSQVLSEVRRKRASGDTAGSLAQLGDLVRSDTLRGEHFTTVGRAIDELAKAPTPGSARTRVAVLGGYTTTPIAAAARCALLAEGLIAEVYEAPFAAFRQEILDSQSGLYRFDPDVTLLAVASTDVTNLPAGPMGPSVVASALDEEVEQWQGLWGLLGERLGKPLLQHLIETPEGNSLGVAERRLPWAPARFIDELNQRLVEAAPGFLRWIDVDRLAAQVGRWNWYDPRLYHYGKVGFSLRFLPEYARAFSGAWRSAVGRTKKALVLDLDDTLWGGVIGDDGLDGIRLGTGTAEGEAYLDFCRYVNGLKDRGVILAVCSKNDPKVATEVFDRHPEIPLKPAHFGAFVCNWSDKASNLRQIALDLNIDISSLVFVDDSPAECELIRRELPEVAVIHLPEDPAQFVRVVDSFHYFDAPALSDEDIKRSSSYVARRKAARLQAQATDLDSYLKALDMTGTVYQAGKEDLLRLSQMELKTSQFNLTTQRYGEEEILGFIEDADRLCLAFRLHDRFAEHGLVSSLLAVNEEGTLRIKSWLMSCRIFSRTAEQYIMNRLVEIAVSTRVTRVVGEYVPTQKNGVVKNLYSELGFHRLEGGEDGRWWELALDHSDIKPLTTFIGLWRP